jgi:hypothetical protein
VPISFKIKFIGSDHAHPRLGDFLYFGTNYPGVMTDCRRHRSGLVTQQSIPGATLVHLHRALADKSGPGYSFIALINR